MKTGAILRCLLAVSVLAALLFAPMKRAEAAHAGLTAMAAMDCCPKAKTEHKAKTERNAKTEHGTGDCPDCPLMALCAAPFIVRDASPDVFHGRRSVVASRMIPAAAPLSAGRTNAPPLPPPRA